MSEFRDIWCDDLVTVDGSEDGRVFCSFTEEGERMATELMNERAETGIVEDSDLVDVKAEIVASKLLASPIRRDIAGDVRQLDLFDFGVIVQGTKSPSGRLWFDSDKWKTPKAEAAVLVYVGTNGATFLGAASRKRFRMMSESEVSEDTGTVWLMRQSDLLDLDWLLNWDHERLQAELPSLGITITHVGDNQLRARAADDGDVPEAVIRAAKRHRARIVAEQSAFCGGTREEQMEKIIRENLRRYGHLPNCRWNGYGPHPKHEESPCTCWVNPAKALLGMEESEWTESAT